MVPYALETRLLVPQTAILLLSPLSHASLRSSPTIVVAWNTLTSSLPAEFSFGRRHLVLYRSPSGDSFPLY